MNDEPADLIPYEGEIVRQAGPPHVANNPFASAQSEHISLGAVAIESQRVAAEVQGRMIVAKRFPRDSGMAYARAMQACERLGLADCAIYSYNKGGKVEGPSIRLAEELARCWGNIEYGLIELSRRPGESEMEAFAWDIETNTRSSQKFTVKHIRDRSDSKGGNAALTAERDIYEITANNGARRMRARILAILPPELVDDAVAACKETVKRGGGQPLGDRIRLMIGAFAKVGVTAQMVADKVGHAIDQITPDELADLRGVLQAIKDGAKAGEFFVPKAALPTNADGFEMAAAGQKMPPTQKASTSDLADLIRSVNACNSLAGVDETLKAQSDKMKGLPDTEREQLMGVVNDKRRSLPKAA